MTIKIVLSSPLRTLPQSLRDSSLSDGAFEKVAAVLFGSLRSFYAGDQWSPLQYMVQFGMPPYVCSHRGQSRTPVPTMNEGVRTISRLQPMFALIKSLPQWGKVAAEG